MSDINTRTVNELIDRYERDGMSKLADSTAKDYGRHLARLREVFGSRVVGQLVRADIEAFLRVPDVARGAVQRNKHISVLSSVLVQAMKWGWVTHNVCSNVRRNVSGKQKRNLTEQEFEGVRKLAPTRTRAAMDLAMFTRQPQNNVLTLRWDQVDDHVIRFRDPKVRDKAKRKVEIEITSEIRLVLDECRKLSGNSEYVISKNKKWGGGRYTNDGFRAIWQRLMRKWERRGNDRFTFHDIRATAERLFMERQARKTELTNAVADYPQFENVLREEAALMAEYYQVFYCLEQKIRRLIVRRMNDAVGPTWWDTHVPTDTKNAADKLRQREVESGITPRSDNMIDYTSFGELSGIIASNWGVFDLAFHNKPAVQRVLHQLNLLRGPIAHCCAMTPDEIHRLGIAIKDWFRQARD